MAILGVALPFARSLLPFVISKANMNKITIRFDGGCRPTNPGNKYGSFEVSMNGRQVILVSRQEFGWGTNNEAEFDALSTALEWTVKSILDSGNSPSLFDVEIFSDSTIVVNRINGKNTKSKSEPQMRMKNLAVKCLGKLVRFNSFKAAWNSRDNNVEKFGH